MYCWMYCHADNYCKTYRSWKSKRYLGNRSRKVDLVFSSFPTDIKMVIGSPYRKPCDSLWQASGGPPMDGPRPKWGAPQVRSSWGQIISISRQVTSVEMLAPEIMLGNHAGNHPKIPWRIKEQKYLSCLRDMPRQIIFSMDWPTKGRKHS